MNVTSAITVTNTQGRPPQVVLVLEPTSAEYARYQYLAARPGGLESVGRSLAYALELSRAAWACTERAVDEDF
jgi:hypothetical protein